MAYARIADESRDFDTALPKPKNAAGFFRRLFDLIVEGRGRAAEREIETMLARRGGKLTDDAEREIDRILFSSRF
jgi:hypothetical protein